MRETQAAKEQSKPRQLIQAYLRLLLHRAGNQELPLPRREEFPRTWSLGVSAKAGLSRLRHYCATCFFLPFSISNGEWQRQLPSAAGRQDERARTSAAPQAADEKK